MKTHSQVPTVQTSQRPWKGLRLPLLSPVFDVVHSAAPSLPYVATPPLNVLQFAHVMKSPQFAGTLLLRTAKQPFRTTCWHSLSTIFAITSWLEGSVKIDVLKKITKSEMAPALFTVLSENGRLGELGKYRLLTVWYFSVYILGAFALMKILLYWN